jgi:hypothetical protein
LSPNIKIEAKQLFSGKFKNPATRPGFLVLARLAIGRFSQLSVAFMPQYAAKRGALANKG